MRQKFLSLSLILVLAFSAVAQQQRAAESAPSVERLRAHVTYLASDKLEGRRTGSEGANLAAEYIAKEFSRYGLRRSIGYDTPGMSILEADSPHRYMQEFPFVAGVELAKNNAMTFTPNAQGNAPQAASTSAGSKPVENLLAKMEQQKTQAASLDLRLGEDWMPLGFSSNAKVSSAPVTFVGYGLKADEIGYDDYAGVSVKNRVAIAFEGTPDGDNPHGHFARYADVRWKAIAARNNGASALVVIAREDSFKDDRLSQLRYDNSSGEAGLPVVVISRQAAERIFEAGGARPVAEMETAVQEVMKKLAQAATGNNDARWTASLPLERVTLSITTDVARRNAPAYNVVGILEGSDPVLKREAIDRKSVV